MDTRLKHRKQGRAGVGGGLTKVGEIAVGEGSGLWLNLEGPALISQMDVEEGTSRIRNSLYRGLEALPGNHERK